MFSFDFYRSMWLVAIVKVHLAIFFQSIIKMGTYRMMTFHWSTWNIYANALNKLNIRLFSSSLQIISKDIIEKNPLYFWSIKYNNNNVICFFLIEWNKPSSITELLSKKDNVIQCSCSMFKMFLIEVWWSHCTWISCFHENLD